MFFVRIMMNCSHQGKCFHHSAGLRPAPDLGRLPIVTHAAGQAAGIRDHHRVPHLSRQHKPAPPGNGRQTAGASRIERIRVRDSRHPRGVVLRFSQGGWDAFLDKVRTGEFGPR
jgi:Domain of unknown function (DUF397)